MPSMFPYFLWQAILGIQGEGLWEGETARWSFINGRCDTRGAAPRPHLPRLPAASQSRPCRPAGEPLLVREAVLCADAFCRLPPAPWGTGPSTPSRLPVSQDGAAGARPCWPRSHTCQQLNLGAWCPGRMATPPLGTADRRPRREAGLDDAPAAEEPAAGNGDVRCALLVAALQHSRSRV